MAFGFPAYAEGVRKYDCSYEELIRAIYDTLHELGWNFGHTADSGLVVKLRTNFWSWGERMNVAVTGPGTVHVLSECILPTQCFDWGKNRRNIARFLDNLSRILHSRLDRSGI
jgi:hypothetical protein